MCENIYVNCHNKNTQDVLGSKVCQQEMSRYLRVFGEFSNLITFSQFVGGENMLWGQMWDMAEYIQSQDT